jgi:P2-related tail formation protein
MSDKTFIAVPEGYADWPEEQKREWVAAAVATVPKPEQAPEEET